jgi:DNA modification methylase
MKSTGAMAVHGATENAAQLSLNSDLPDEVIQTSKPFRWVQIADARSLLQLPDNSVDLVVTSPPYWRKRDYKLENQIGQEKTPEQYVANIISAMREWRRVLRPSGSVFLNIGDTYWQTSLQGIPSSIEVKAKEDGWRLRNRIVWVKSGGTPDPAKDRLTPRHEYILHFALNGYYYDLFGYAEQYSSKNTGANPGDVWTIKRERNLGKHLAPFPSEIAERVITLACPKYVCTKCGTPRRRIVQRTAELDPSRPQAKRAMELARQKGLTPEHIAAIQATGISDAGKARFTQSGTNKNAEEVKRLAAEAKVMLGGYFREFTFAKRKSCGWTDCGCGVGFAPGIVLDPFMGTAKTLDVAQKLGRSCIGVDLDLSAVEESAE